MKGMMKKCGRGYVVSGIEVKKNLKNLNQTNLNQGGIINKWKKINI